MKTKTTASRPGRFALHITCILLLAASTAFAESLIKPKARIIFVGDSITGQSVNRSDGFNHLLRWTLSQSFESNSVPELISLGGSGQGIASWINTAERSVEKEVFLDIKGVDVKSSLEKKADIMFFMLGMNDLLCPYVKPTTEDMDHWAANYIKLIENLRGRAKPDVIGIASIPLLTNAEDSPKDLIRKQLNKRARDIAEKRGFLYVETGEAMRRLQDRGRQLDPAFKLGSDFVHPGLLGHVAISVAMLEALGDMKSGKILRDKYFETGTFDLSQKPRLSYELKLEDSPLNSDVSRYSIKYYYTPKAGEKSDVKVSLSMKNDGQSLNNESTNSAGSFNVSLTLDQPRTRLILTAVAGKEALTCEIEVPMPWLVTAGMPHQEAWQGSEFKPEKGVFECEAGLVKGKGFDAPLTIKEISYPWQRYAASINFSGLDNPDSLDWYAATYCNTFDAAYATRWIYSAKEREAQLELGHDTFSATVGLSIWINGTTLAPVTLTRNTHDRQYRPISLKKGWNHLLLRSDHTTWQWQHICTIKPVGADTLEDIRYSIVPK